MKFESRQFSKRQPPLTCAVIVYHEPPREVVLAGQPESATMYRTTAAAIVDANGDAWMGFASCSDADQFVRSTGREKAVGRAYQAFLIEARPFYTHFDLTVDQPISQIVVKLKQMIAIWKKQIIER